MGHIQKKGSRRSPKLPLVAEAGDSVVSILDLLAREMSFEAILSQNPNLSNSLISDALHRAAEIISEQYSIKRALGRPLKGTRRPVKERLEVILRDAIFRENGTFTGTRIAEILKCKQSNFSRIPIWQEYKRLRPGFLKRAKQAKKEKARRANQSESIGTRPQATSEDLAMLSSNYYNNRDS